MSHYQPIVFPPLKPIQYITAKEVAAILDCSSSTAYRRLRAIKKSLGKPKTAVVCYDEFFDYVGIDKNQYFKEASPTRSGGGKHFSETYQRRF